MGKGAQIINRGLGKIAFYLTDPADLAPQRFRQCDQRNPARLPKRAQIGPEALAGHISVLQHRARVSMKF